MSEIFHLIGNGRSAHMFNSSVDGMKMTCNLPPFPVDAFATAIVDFKMMRAIQAEELIVPGDWVLGFRPKLHLEKNPSMYLKYAANIKEFYLTLPDYCPNYTDFSCGHFAAHYLCTKFSPNELHMYGFDSLFNFDLHSCSDFYLPSERDVENTARLTNNWRNVWPKQFAEFPNTKFVLHGAHNDLRIIPPKNVEVVIH